MFDFWSDEANGIQIPDMNPVNVAIAAELHLDEIEYWDHCYFDALHCQMFGPQFFAGDGEVD